jgi:hypothetical protein
MFIMILTALFFSERYSEDFVQAQVRCFQLHRRRTPISALFATHAFLLSDKDATDFIREKAAEGNIAKKSMLVMLHVFLSVCLLRCLFQFSSGYGKKRSGCGRLIGHYQRHRTHERCTKSHWRHGEGAGTKLFLHSTSC